MRTGHAPAAALFGTWTDPEPSRDPFAYPVTGTLEQFPSHEVVGTRVGHVPTHELVQVWAAATSGIVKYGFAIEYRDLDPPRTGIFDGLRIVIDPDVGFEMQCFLLLHLFGHSAQWVAPSIEHKLEALQHAGPPVVQVLGLEFEPGSAQLLHERGVTGQDQWYAISSPTGASSVPDRPAAWESASSAAARSFGRLRSAVDIARSKSVSRSSYMIGGVALQVAV